MVLLSALLYVLVHFLLPSLMLKPVRTPATFHFTVLNR
jgi:hypothetical protein